MTQKRISLRHVLVVIAAFATLTPAVAVYADGLEDAGKLLRQGQTKQALEQVDGYLANHPKDASGRFLRGVILTEMNRSGEAIAIFTKLTEDYPKLPEPYNNLAVIYAQQKQYDKAQTALEAAIRTHPAYATAHENLGDIYARLASQAYDKALQLDSSNKVAQTKLSMIQGLITVSARPATPSTSSAVVAKPIVPVSAQPALPQPTVSATAGTPAKDAMPADSAPIAAAKPAEPIKPAPKPEIQVTANKTIDDEVAKVLAGWAEAWSRKDARDYLDFYAPDFKTPGGVSRNTWAAERTKRVTKPGKINVNIEEVRVVPQGENQAVVKFRQHYKSSSLSSSSNKTLLMTKHNGQWKILQERIGG